MEPFFGTEMTVFVGNRWVVLEKQSFSIYYLIYFHEIKRVFSSNVLDFNTSQYFIFRGPCYLKGTTPVFT